MISLDQAYFEWLVRQIRVGYKVAGRTPLYEGLFRQLHEKEFVFTVTNDENRIGDGLDLRHEFVTGLTAEDPVDSGEIRFPCTMLELIIGLSRRLEFNAGGDRASWAWTLIENLRIHRLHDPLSQRDRDQIDDVLETLIYRTYEPDGYGGFFPLAFPKEDQCSVELWYQMAAYIDEIPDHV